MPLNGPRLNAYDLDLAEHEHESASLPAPLGTDPDRPSALLSDGLNRFSDFPFTPVERQRWSTCGNASADCLSLKGFSVATTTIGDGTEVDVYNLHLDRDPDGDQFATLLADTGPTAVCTALGCDEPNRIDKVLFRSGDTVEITPVEWCNDAVRFTRDDDEPLSDHDPVAVRLQFTAA